MENRDKQNKASDQETDLSKAQNQQQPQSGQQGGQFQQPPEAQSQQQPFGQSQQPPEAKSQQQPFGQSQQQSTGQSQQQPTNQADYGSAGAGQSDTTTEQRSDIESGTSTSEATDIEGSSQFVGSKGADDTSSDLIDDEDQSDFAKDRRGDGE